jgi:hypothetical protein
MTNMTKNKIQSLIVEHLLKHGQIELVLPDGVTLEIGLTQEDQEGKLTIHDDYCWVIASQGGRATSIDSYNMGLRFADKENILVFEDKFVDQDGEKVRRLDVV